MAFAMETSAISQELWRSALTALERRFSKPVYEMWIKPMRLVSLSGNELLLGVHNNFARDWVENRLKAQIIEALSETFGTAFEMQFVVVEQPGESPPAEGGAAVSIMLVWLPFRRLPRARTSHRSSLCTVCRCSCASP